VTIRVFQGEREMAADNKVLGQFDLIGLPSAPRGVPQIEVTFDIDANGIVQVSAKDKATNKEQQIRIQASGGLSDEDIEQMVQEAEVNADSDKEKREEIEARNQAESLIHQTESTLSDLGDEVPEAEKTEIDTAITELKAALEDEKTVASDIKEKTDTLMQASMKLGEMVYRKQQESEAGAADSESADDNATENSSDDVIDADFTEVDDKKDNDEDAKSA
jgi:molecular chaperone DnaK